MSVAFSVLWVLRVPRQSHKAYMNVTPSAWNSEPQHMPVA